MNICYKIWHYAKLKTVLRKASNTGNFELTA